MLIGHAAGEGITPLNGARGRQRLDFLSVLSFRSSSAADAKTSNVEEISETSVILYLQAAEKNYLLRMNTNYLVEEH